MPKENSLTFGEEIGPYRIRSSESFKLGTFGDTYFATDQRTSTPTYLKVLREYESAPVGEQFRTRQLPDDRFVPYAFSNEKLASGRWRIITHPRFFPGLSLLNEDSDQQIEKRNLGQTRAMLGKKTSADFWALFPFLIGLAKDALDAGAEEVTISPQNLLYVEMDDRFRLLEAGVHLDPAKFLEHKGVTTVAPDALQYLAPEYLRALQRGAHDEARNPEREAVYSIGMTMFRLMTNALPFPGTSAADVIERVTGPKRQDLRAARGLNQRVQRLLARCLERDPAQRIASLDDLRRELTTLPSDPWLKDPQPRWVNWVKIGAAACSVVILASVAMWWLSAEQGLRRSDELASMLTPTWDHQLEVDDVKRAFETHWQADLGKHWLYLGHLANWQVRSAVLPRDRDSVAQSLDRAITAATQEGRKSEAAHLLAERWFLRLAYEDGPHAVDQLEADLTSCGLELPPPLQGSCAEQILHGVGLVLGGANKLAEWQPLAGEEGVATAYTNSLERSSAPSEFKPLPSVKDWWITHHMIAEVAKVAGAKALAGERFLLAARRRAMQSTSSEPAKQPQHPVGWRRFAENNGDGGSKRVVEELHEVVFGGGKFPEELSPSSAVRRSQWAEVLGDAHTALVERYLEARLALDPNKLETFDAVFEVLDAVEGGTFLKKGAIPDGLKNSLMGMRGKAVVLEMKAVLAQDPWVAERNAVAYDRAEQVLAKGGLVKAEELRPLCFRLAFERLGDPDKNSEQAKRYSEAALKLWLSTNTLPELPLSSLDGPPKNPFRKRDTYEGNQFCVFLNRRIRWAGPEERDRLLWTLVGVLGGKEANFSELQDYSNFFVEMVGNAQNLEPSARRARLTLLAEHLPPQILGAKAPDIYLDLARIAAEDALADPPKSGADSIDAWLKRIQLDLLPPSRHLEYWECRADQQVAILNSLPADRVADRFAAGLTRSAALASARKERSQVDTLLPGEVDKESQALMIVCREFAALARANHKFELNTLEQLETRLDESMRRPSPMPWIRVAIEVNDACGSVGRPKDRSSARAAALEKRALDEWKLNRAADFTSTTFDGIKKDPDACDVAKWIAARVVASGSDVARFEIAKRLDPNNAEYSLGAVKEQFLKNFNSHPYAIVMSFGANRSPTQVNFWKQLDTESSRKLLRELKVDTRGAEGVDRLTADDQIRYYWIKGCLHYIDWQKSAQSDDQKTAIAAFAEVARLIKSGTPWPGDIKIGGAEADYAMSVFLAAYRSKLEDDSSPLRQELRNLIYPPGAPQNIQEIIGSEFHLTLKQLAPDPQRP